MYLPDPLLALVVSYLIIDGDPSRRVLAGFDRRRAVGGRGRWEARAGKRGREERALGRGVRNWGAVRRLIDTVAWRLMVRGGGRTVEGREWMVKVVCPIGMSVRTVTRCLMGTWKSHPRGVVGPRILFARGEGRLSYTYPGVAAQLDVRVLSIAAFRYSIFEYFLRRRQQWRISPTKITFFMEELPLTRMAHFTRYVDNEHVFII